VLVGFVFADESGSKKRPALIVGALARTDLDAVDRELRRSLAL